jgi:bifunctional enzyme CysN/CysC
MAATRLADWLRADAERDQLRFITCGSVDDGKSTLIGRLLAETGALLDDQRAALEADSRRLGTCGDDVDYALLLDGLEDERAQGITIDVAYRYFATARRKFVVADCPGHVQYTRNMATGASNAELAVVLVDARKGLLPQTARHSYICALFGIREVILAVNKMDLVDFDASVFAAIAGDYAALAQRLGIARVQAVPLSARHGDNLAAPSPRMPWHAGRPLLELLETVQLEDRARARPMRLPVQWVNRPHQDFRGLAGTLAAGSIGPGDAVRVLPSGRSSTVREVLGVDGPVARAEAGQAITVTLVDDLDATRGDVLAAADAAASIADQFAAHLLWMDEAPLLPGRSYALRLGTATANATVGEIRHRVDVDTQAPLAARHLDLNEVGLCHLALDRPLAFAPFAEDPALGAFILMDRQSNATVAAGRIEFALRRAANLHWQALDVDRAARAALKAQRPRCLWFTGLSGAGKSTIANLVERQLHAAGRHTYLLDGDNVRHGLNRDLGFTAEDRVENIRRVAEVARLMVDAGLIVLVSFISPFRAERRMARERFATGEFVEVFVDAPLALAESRDAKGLYAKARRGELPNFTGIDSPYETPQDPELRLDTARFDAEALATQVLDYLARVD